MGPKCCIRWDLHTWDSEGSDWVALIKLEARYITQILVVKPTQQAQEFSPNPFLKFSERKKKEKQFPKENPE